MVCASLEAEAELAEAQLKVVDRKITSAAKGLFEIVNPINTLTGKRTLRGRDAHGISIVSLEHTVREWLRLGVEADPLPLNDFTEVALFLREHSIHPMVHGNVIETATNKQIERMDALMEDPFGLDVTPTQVDNDVMSPNPYIERVTLAEAAKRLGTTHQNLCNLRRRYPSSFPKNDKNIVGASVFRWVEVKAYYESRMVGGVE
jgi:hypothetical protein